MATTSPIRIDDELYESASIVGPTMSRSASQQVSHWARIGREVEAGGLSTAAITEVLAGARRYDELDERAQALIRAEWTDLMAARRSALDLRSEFEAAGETYAELDEDGNVVERTASSI